LIACSVARRVDGVERGETTREPDRDDYRGRPGVERSLCPGRARVD
jgi:hypothetical protein